MNRCLIGVVCLAFVIWSNTAGAQVPAPAVPGSPVTVTPAAPGKADESKAVSKPKSVDELLAGIDAKAAAAKARQEEIDKKVKSISDEETKIRTESMETSKKMWGVTDLGSDSGDDQEMAELKKKISELDAQIKELREQMQKKLENNPEFLQRKIKLQDSQKALMKLRQERGEMMQEKAKLNAELNQLERDRLPLLQRKEAEAAKKAEEAKAAGAK
jgi:chromosome segregation ATPase